MTIFEEYKKRDNELSLERERYNSKILTDSKKNILMIEDYIRNKLIIRKTSHYRLSKSSLFILQWAHPLFQYAILIAIKTSRVDFGISETFRSATRQQGYYIDGKSTKDGYKNLSKHQKFPSHAIDVYCYDHLGVTWDRAEVYQEVFGKVEEALFNICSMMNKEINVIWGGNWSNTDLFWKNSALIDFPHIQIKTRDPKDMLDLKMMNYRELEKMNR